MAVNHEYAAASVKHFAAKLALDMFWFSKNKEHFTVERVRETIKKAAEEYAEEEMKRNTRECTGCNERFNPENMHGPICESCYENKFS